MAEPIFGLTRGAAQLVSEMAAKHRQRLPDEGRRTRRVWPRGEMGAGDLGTDCICCPDCACCPTDATLYTTACAAFPKLFKNYTLSGKAPWGGRTLVWDSGCIFYSASFNITLCGVDYGSHRWKWTAAEAIDTSILTLEEVGTAATVIALRYKNKWHLDPWCGNDFGIIERWLMPCAIAHDPPKVLCISPVADLCPPCPSLVNTPCCATPMPTVLTAALTSSCAEVNGQTASLTYVPGSGYTWSGTISAGACGTLTVAVQLNPGPCVFNLTIYSGANQCFSGGTGVPLPCPFTTQTISGAGTWQNPPCTCCVAGGWVTAVISV